MIWLLLFCTAVNEFRVNTIEIKGNEYFEASAIKKVMLIKPPAFLRKGHFRMDVFKGDLEAIKNLYIYEGFVDVEVAHELHFDSTERQVDVLLLINEGEQTFVKSISLEGINLFDEESLKQEMVMKPEQPFDRRNIDIDKGIITYLYDDRGYADVSVKSEYNIENDEVIVYHRVTEGEKQYIDKIEISGLERTRKVVVSRVLKVKQGDVFRYARLLESQRELYKLGIFTSIRIQVEASERPADKNIRFVLTEKDAIMVNFRIGYGTKDLLRFGAGFTHLNLLGRAWKGDVEGKLSFTEQRISTKIAFPRSYLLPGRLNVGLYYQVLEEIGYKTFSLGTYVTTHFDYRIDRFSVRYDLEHIRTHYESEDSATTDLLHGITTTWARDKRDNPFSARRGYYISASTEMSGIFLPSDVDYVRPVLQFRFYKPLWRLVFGTALRAGIVREIAPTVEIPIYKRYFCGGASSVRGYGERAIGPVDENGNPLGGNYLGEISAELRFPIYKFLGGVVFVDGGNIWQDGEEISSGLRWGVGGGLRLKSLLGSIRLDYGFKIQRQADESIGQVHFAIGEAF
jgi:outer membrane protein assembly complex protein YaeT